MIVVVAPYLKVEEGGSPALGAARKIEIVISILAKIDADILLVNSADFAEWENKITLRNTNICRTPVREMRMGGKGNYRIDKAKSLLYVKKAVDEVLKIGEPSCTWFYNGYAFEMLFAIIMARKRPQQTMILEFEDWHFARPRGLNPKPLLDRILWQMAAPLFRAGFAVNANLLHKLRSMIDEATLLPGIVPEQLVALAEKKEPFSDPGKIIIGYFGGLHEEKGGKLLLALADLLPDNYALHITGSGDLTEDFVRAATRRPGKLVFFGPVSDEELYQIIAGCDIILNPHDPSLTMKEGIFPFKVAEAVASKRLLISTLLPKDGYEELLACVHFVSYSPENFCNAILQARATYQELKPVIEESSLYAIDEYGAESILKKIQGIIATPKKQHLLSAPEK